MSGYAKIKFNTTDSEQKTVYNSSESGEYKAVKIAAIANKYDLVGTIGEDNIRNTVTEEWKNSTMRNTMGINTEDDIKKAVDKYITEVNNNYNHVSSSTDFKFYDDENVKVFAKELKEYDGVTLEYIGIMPKKETLKSYINNLDTETKKK